MTAPVPELVPTQMFNEFSSYCPRMFFLVSPRLRVLGEIPDHAAFTTR